MMLKRCCAFFLLLPLFSSAYGAEEPASDMNGKEAVIRKIQELFKNSAGPIVQTREFKPAEPYMSIQKIPAKDALTPGRAIIVYRLRFVDAKKAQDAVEGIVGENGTVEVSQNQNMIVANVEDSSADAVKASLLSLDMPQPQVLVEAQIVEVSLERGEARDTKVNFSHISSNGTVSTMGYNMSSPGQKISDSNSSAGFDIFPVDNSSNTLELALNWLNTSTDAKILASPNIIADLNSEASMKTGEEIPYNEAAVTNTAVTNNFKFKKTGINLKIKPVLINKDTVRLEIQPEISLLLRYDEFPQTGSSTTIKVPVVSVRSISTTLTAADGEVLMLGGLYSSERSERLRKTPIIGDIPLLGDLFNGKDFTIYDKQLIFFMKIHILPTPYSVLTDPEKNVKTIRGIGDAVRGSEKIFVQEPVAQKTNTGMLDFLFDDDAKPEEVSSLKEPEAKPEVKAK